MTRPEPTQGAPARHTADTITPAALDQLYAELEELRALLHDAEGDRDSWATDARRSEAEADTLRAERHTYQRAWHSARDRARKAHARAEKAEALLRQYLSLTDITHKYPIQGGHDCLGVNLTCAGCALADEIRAALDEPQEQQ